MIENGKEEFLNEITRKQENEAFSKKEISEAAAKHDLPLWHAESVSSFYRQSNANVRICNGLPCSIRSENHLETSLESNAEGGVERVSCLGYCDHAPVIWREGKYFQAVDGDLKEIKVGKHRGDGEYQRALSEYVANNGFSALQKVIDEQDKSSVVSLAEKWGLRGMGGAGFPTYIKWDAVMKSQVEERYLVVNAHEGEPGTFKDRIIMETRPYELLEAAILAAVVIDARNIIIALKWEYNNSERILKNALTGVEEFLEKIMPDFKPPRITISRIPGYYVTGEETALLEAIEGFRSEPRIRPPFPAEAGLHGKPTLIDNVETLVYFLGLLRNHFTGNETKEARKAYCLTGDVIQPGAYFLEYGIKARDLFEKLGGASLSDLKAFLPGGLSGGILPAELADTHLDYSSVRNLGAGLGTGSVIAISKERCLVRVIGNVEQFFAVESCGKCIPCRLGTKDLNGLFSRLQLGEAALEDLEMGEKTAKAMITGSICGLGQAAGRMYLDALKHFRSEIVAHTSGNCPANVCFRER